MGRKICCVISKGENILKFKELSLKGAYLIELEKIEDERGFFSRTWDKKIFEEKRLNSNLVQCNISFNKKKGFFDHPVYWDVDNNYRVMLAHCKDDEIINYENFEINRKFLNLNPKNYIVFEKGNHSFAGMETALIGKMLLWFWQRGY